MGGEHFSKKSVVAGQKIFISKRGCIITRPNFLKGVQAIFGENRTLHICSIANN